MADDALKNIYDRIKNAGGYHPMKANTFADWALEAGDTVKVSRDGRSYDTPVHTARLRWNGKQEVEIETTGKQERDSVAKVGQKKYGGRGGSGIRNNQGLYKDVWDEDGHLHSQLQLTESTFKVFVEDKYTQMSSGLKLTSSSAALYVDNKYTQMSSGLKLTSSSAALYVDNKYTQMSSGLKLTSSSAALYVDNKYTQMSSGLKLTSSSAALYVDNKYTQMSSGLKLTSSSAALYVDNKYTQMSSGLKLTSSSAALYVDNKYAQMKAGLDLTSSSAALYVDNKYTQMRAGLRATSSSAAVYVESKTNRAYIMARINADGEGEALIDADKVKITGTTTINDVFTITDGSLQIKVNSRFDNKDIMSKTLTLREGSSSTTIDETDLSNLIVRSSVTNNILTLEKKNGETITFSKATSLSGAWSGGKFTVTADPQGNSLFTTITQGAVTKGSSAWTVPINATDSDNPGYSYETGRTVSISVTRMTIARTAAYKNTSGGYEYRGKLYYYDAQAGVYRAASDSDHYWYYSDTNIAGSTHVYY